MEEVWKKEIDKIKEQIQELELEKGELSNSSNDNDLKKTEKQIVELKKKIEEIYLEHTDYRNHEEWKEDMLNMMYPDRHNADFDEDSTYAD